MKTKRAQGAAGVFGYGLERGMTPMQTVAALSVVILLGAAVWSVSQTFAQKNTQLTVTVPQIAGSTSTPDAFATLADAQSTTSTSTASTTLGDIVLSGLITNYLSLQTQGIYTPQVGQSVAQNMGKSLVAPLTYSTHSSAEIKVDADTSATRVLKYRADLRDSLAPLLRNTQPEFEIFGYYIETKDDQYLAKLHDVARDYRDAIALTANVVAPQDAVPYQIGVLNAMEEFAATLDSMADNAHDPLASVVLLQNYNQAESDMLAAFNALITYEKTKLP